MKKGILPVEDGAVERNDSLAATAGSTEHLPRP